MQIKIQRGSLAENVRSSRSPRFLWSTHHLLGSLIIILRWVSVFDDRPTRIPKEERTKKKMTICSDSHGRNEIVMSGESNLYQWRNKGNRVNYNNEEEKKKNLVVWRRGMEVSCVETTSRRNVAVTLYNKPMARWLHSNGHFEAKRCWHFLFPFIVWRWRAYSVWIVVVYR